MECGWEEEVMVDLMKSPKFLFREWDVVYVRAYSRKEATSKVRKRFPKHPVHNVEFNGETKLKNGKIQGLWGVVVMRGRK